MTTADLHPMTTADHRPMTTADHRPMTTADHRPTMAPLPMTTVDRPTTAVQTVPDRPRIATVTATALENADPMPSGASASKASTAAADSAFLSARPTRIVPTAWCAKKTSEFAVLTVAATPMVDPRMMMADLQTMTADHQTMTADLQTMTVDLPMMAVLRMTAAPRMIRSPSARKTLIVRVHSATWLLESVWMKSAMTADLHPMRADLHPMRAATMAPVTATTPDCSRTPASVSLRAPSTRIALLDSLARKPECAAPKVTSVRVKKTSSPRVKPIRIARQRALRARLTASA
jgi:hypothetical protein